jgi:2-polyprenyl-3-methyl-5-hydroxy-6-metoxy-1,4-benzoquinol methylase
MIGFRDKQCYMQGWIYDPDHRPEEEYITLNGEVPKLRFSKSQPEWEEHIGPVSSYFTMKGDQHFSFFEAELESTGEPGQPIVFNYQTKSSTELNRCQEAYIEDSLPIPDGNIFKRVSGDENPFTFRYVGYSTFLKLEALCKKYLAENFGKVDRILDWGCGCGRVSRYFSRYSAETEIHGIDIDPTGINWIKENLNFGNFKHIEPDSKTPYPDGHFDFIFGISIFTHLTEEDHFFWLKELQRIIAKNGIVAVTTGSTIMRARMFNVSIGDQVSDHLSGYSDQGYNAQIEGATGDDAYYRDTFITKEYIQTVWSEYFDILGIHSGLISCLQDMVIMQKKS